MLTLVRLLLLLLHEADSAQYMPFAVQHLALYCQQCQAIADPVPAVQRGILKVCIMSADFWGMKAAGGTATAYHLLAGVLAASRRLKVTSVHRFTAR